MKIRLKVTALIPAAVFVFIILVFEVASGGSFLSSYNVINLFGQALTTIIAGLGMMCVIAMGGTDITHGSLVGMVGALSLFAVSAWGNFIMLPVALLVGIASGFVAGFFNAKGKVPSFMVTLAMLLAMRAGVSIAIGSRTILAPIDIVNIVTNPIFELVSVVVIIALFVYLWNYTRLGFYMRAIGENENAVKYVGINVDKIKIVAFVISGLMAAVAGFFTVSSVGGASYNLGASFEMQVMMAVFVGGVPVVGGRETQIYKVVIGALVIASLQNGLTICNVSGSVTEGISGLILVGAVFFSQEVSRKISDKSIRA